MTDAGAPGRLPPPVPGWLAHGRALFNAGDFWGSHESWERAWRLAPPGPREVIQGLIQAAASGHKLVVQDNLGGSLRLVQRALGNLGSAPDGFLDLALADFRAQLADWAKRLGEPLPTAGPITGFPRLAWSHPPAAGPLASIAVSLSELQLAHGTAILVHVTTTSGGGWGECRVAPGADGVWQALRESVVPVLLAAPVMAPTEFAATPGLYEGACTASAAAGVEAALWDAYARAWGMNLPTVLGHAARPVALTGRAEVGSASEVVASVKRLAAAGYRHATVSARPNAGRRLLPGVVAASPLPLAIELGAAYRMADIQELLVLDGLGASHLSRPFAATSLSEAARLGRLTTTPISLGGWSDPRQLENALALHALGAVELDPGAVGLTAACIMADMAAAHGLPAWVASSAGTAVGALGDLALAAHPGVKLPSDLRACGVAGDMPAVLPDAAGDAQPPIAAGLGILPDPDWLAMASLRRAELRP